MREKGDIQKMRKEIEELKKALWHSAKMVTLGVLNASMVHEFNGPLTGIKGYAQLVLKKCPLEAKFILEQVAQIEEIIENVREFSKRSSFKVISESILKPLGRALAILKAQLIAHGITIKKEIKDPLPLVKIDVGSIQQVFLNLLINAKEAIEEKENKIGVISIEIFDEYSDGQKGNLIIKISDNGTGMSKQTKERLFEAFFTTKEGGLGLGLCIVKDIVNKHNGEISCDSEFGKGTTFVVKLPVVLEKK